LLVGAALTAGVALPGSAAAPQAKTAPKDVMFSGVVTAVTETSLTAVRSGSKESKTFILTPETRIDGPKPKVNSRVTIRYIAGEEGDRAVSVIVRAPAKK
jgi:hypothetical protein